MGPSRWRYCAYGTAHVGIWNCFPDSPAILGIQLSHRFDMRPKVGRYRRTTAKACSRFGQERTRHAPKGRGCVRRIRVKAQAKGTRKISPRVACPAILGIQLSHRFDMRPAAWPPYLPSLLFSISVFQHFSISAFTKNPPLPNDSLEGNHSALVKFTIFSQVSSPRFSASGRRRLADWQMSDFREKRIN